MRHPNRGFYKQQCGYRAGGRWWELRLLTESGRVACVFQLDMTVLEHALLPESIRSVQATFHIYYVIHTQCPTHPFLWDLSVCGTCRQLSVEDVDLLQGLKQGTRRRRRRQVIADRIDSAAWPLDEIGRAFHSMRDQGTASGQVSVGPRPKGCRVLTYGLDAELMW